MDEPPAKRPRRDERDRDGDKEVHNTASPRSPRLHDDRKHDSRTNGYDSRRRDNRDNDRRRKRSRSRSPVKDRQYAGGRRDRSRQRDRPYRDRDRQDRNERDFKQRKLSRSRSPHRNGDGARTRSPGRTGGQQLRTERDRNVKSETKSAAHVKKSDESEAMVLVPVEGEDEETAMKRVMGFGTFRTTKNTKVPGNQIYGVRKEKKTTYRQYMNRVGGFNRPLSPTRT